MTEEELKRIKEELLRLRAEFQEMEETLKETSEPVELDQTRVGRLSRMDAMQSQQMALETVRRRKEHLVKIEGALRRIESDDYGYCFVCGEEIDIRRLLVDPSSTRCMECVDK
ncbi:MAG: TraR/DksA family transcriptional regulator [Gammaproteobacteria bacterium]|nr:TraR/DksA family transcriptional regulator [Gammaproteobacteria bacterium]